MNVYVFQAALYCEACGHAIRDTLMPDADSDHYPQGPYSDGGGEADSPQHCDACNTFLENPLTGDGYEYIRQQIKLHRPDVDSRKLLARWSTYYQIPF